MIKSHEQVAVTEPLGIAVAVPGVALVPKVIAPTGSGKPLEDLCYDAGLLSPVVSSVVDVFKELQNSVAFE